MKNVRLTVLASLVGFFGLGVGTASAVVIQHKYQSVSTNPTNSFQACTLCGFGLAFPDGDFALGGNVAATASQTHNAAQSFSDTWFFRVAGLVELEDTLVVSHDAPGLHPVRQILNIHFDLFDGAALIASSGTGNGISPDVVEINNVILHAGDHYKFVVTGTVPKGDIGVYDLNTTISSGVPELSTWAMMIIGFGGVGMQIRRRNSALNAVA